MAQETVKRYDDLTKAQRRRLAIQLMLRSLAVAAFLFIAYYACSGDRAGVHDRGRTT
jgi:hypothetical protein